MEQIGWQAVVILEAKVGPGERRDLLDGEALEGHRGCVWLAGELIQLIGCGNHVGVTPEPQHENGRCPPNDVPEKTDRRLAGPLEIVEHEHHRTGGRRCQHVSHGIKDAAPTRSGTLRTDVAPRLDEAQAQAREDRVQHVPMVLANGFEVRDRRRPSPPIQRVDPGLIRQPRLALTPAVQDDRTLGAGPVAELRGEGGLARPGFAGYQHKASTPIDDHALVLGQQPSQVVSTADEAFSGGKTRWMRRTPRRDRGMRHLEQRVLLEDRLLESAQLAARLHTKEADELAPCLLIRIERLSLSAGSVQREHEQRPRPLPQGFPGDDARELSDQPVIAPGFETSFRQVFGCLAAQFVESGRQGTAIDRRGQLRNNRAGPQRTGRAKSLDRLR